MRASATTALAAVMAAAAIWATPAAQSRAGLTVRLYNTAGISVAEFASARRTADAVLRDTGLVVTFRSCARVSSAQRPADLCADRLHAREVVVRIIDAPAFNATLPVEAFGVAYVVKETDRGWLATVFADRVDAAAARVSISPGSLLGLVMAHEVGHLLLGVGYHGPTGVMRADWSDDLLGRKNEEWRFSRIEAARLRQAASNP